jgi:hypothetical protein
MHLGIESSEDKRTLAHGPEVRPVNCRQRLEQQVERAPDSRSAVLPDEFVRGPRPSGGHTSYQPDTSRSWFGRGSRRSSPDLSTSICMRDWSVMLVAHRAHGQTGKGFVSVGVARS